MLVDSDKSKIIEYLLNNPEMIIRVVKVAKAVGISKGYVSKIVKSLESDGVIKNNLPDMSNPYLRALKVLYNANKIMEKRLPTLLKRLGASGAGVYGSWANGTNNEESDIDIWIRPKKRIPEASISSVSRQIRETLGTNPQIIVLSDERLEQIRKTNTVFYYSLVFNSILLFGEPFERT